MKRKRRLNGIAIAVLSSALLAVGLLATGPLQAARPQQATASGDAVDIAADQIDFDDANGTTLLTGHVEVTSGTRVMRADHMTLKTVPGNRQQIEWAKASGHVYLEDKTQPTGEGAKPSTMTATGERGEYHDPDEKATLEGNVVIHYSAETLAEPAVITGARGDIDMKADRAVVHGSPERQAKAVVKPKGQTPAEGEQPKPPEAIELTANELTRDGKARVFTATGNPKLVRGTTATMTAEKIWFELDPQKDDLKTAHGDEHVVVDDEDPQNGHIHATGDHVIYDQPNDVLTMTGNIHATQKLKDQPEPRTVTGGEFVYYGKTKKWSMRRAPGDRVRGHYPQPPKPASTSTPAAQPAPAAGASRSK